MYRILKRAEWHKTNSVGGRDGAVIMKALEPLQGQEVTEAQLRFTMDVVASELRGDAWAAFTNNLPQLLAARRISMDYAETTNMKMAAVRRIKEAIDPLRQMISSEVTSRLDDVARNWGVDGLEFGIAKIAEKRLVASILNTAKIEGVCRCGHSPTQHGHDRDRGTRPCRRCDKTGHACGDYQPISLGD